MRRVEIDPDGTAQSCFGIIVRFPTGVVYEQQCAGLLAARRTAEGYFVPLGGSRYNPDEGHSDWRDLRAIFHPRLRCCEGQGPPHDLARLRTAVATVTCWASAEDSTDLKRMHLALDESRLAEIVEAWVPVRTPDGPAVLIWPNCD